MAATPTRKGMPQEECQSLLAAGKCFYYKEVGHITPNCPKKTKRGTTVKSIEATSPA